MSVDARSSEQFSASMGAGWLVPLVVLVIAGLAIVGWTLVPAIAVGDAANDALFLADGARRMASGQWPHIDFSLPTGALPYALYWAAQAWLPGVPAFMGMQILGFLVVSPFLILSTANMPSLWARVALTLIVAVTAILPFNVTANGLCTPDLFASYNRLGAAFSLAFLPWIFRTREGQGIAGPVAVIVAAVLVAISIKVVYAGVVLAPLGVLFLLDRRWRIIALTALVGVVAVLGTVELTTGLVRGYVHDILSMSAVNGPFAKYFLGSFVYKHFFTIGLSIALVAWLMWEANDRVPVGTGLLFRLQSLAVPLAMGAAVFAVVVSESQSTGGMAMTAALSLLFAPGLLTARSQSQTRLILVTGVAVAIGGPLLVTAAQRSYCSLSARNGENIATDWSRSFLPYAVVPAEAARIAEANAQIWETADEASQQLYDDLMEPIEHLRYLTEWKTAYDAITVLRERGLDSDLGKTTTISFVDLFGTALQTDMPKGVKVVPVIERTIAELSDAEASAYLADADTVFQPTCGVTKARPGFRLDTWFLPTLEREFSATPLTNCWTMYRRKS
jgi:hypothetical protein